MKNQTKLSIVDSFVEIYEQDKVWSGIADSFATGSDLAMMTANRIVEINQGMRSAIEAGDTDWGKDARVKGKAKTLTEGFRKHYAPRDADKKPIPYAKWSEDDKKTINQTIKNAVSMIKTCFEERIELVAFDYNTQKKAPKVDLMTGELKSTGTGSGAARAPTVKTAGYWITKALKSGEGFELVMTKLALIVTNLSEDELEDFDHDHAEAMLLEACRMAGHISQDEINELRGTDE